MPRFDYAVESPVARSFRVEAVRGMFDVPDAKSVRHEWHADLPVEARDWTVGLVVGPSGSGKTTIGRGAFPDAHFHSGYDWPEKAAVVDGFPDHLDGKEVTASLSAVGFSSPPHWLKRFAHLSNGQKFRCEVARLMLEDAETVVCDEFTSVIDRDAAKVCSAAVAKAVRARKRPKLIALSCHYDVIDWLDPDWVFDTANNTFAWRLLRGRPRVELRVHEASPSAWPMFRDHHYLTGELHKAARCFVATWDGHPVAFTSWIHFPHSIVKNAKRGHRTVVLPDYQGVGIGGVLNRWRGAFCKTLGFRFYFTSGHPALIHHCARSPLWRTQEVGHKRPPGKTGDKSMAKTLSCSRITGSFEYTGPAFPAGGVADWSAP